MGVGGVSDSFACAWDLFLLLGCLILLDRKVCVKSFCNLLGHAWLISLGSLLFFFFFFKRNVGVDLRKGRWEREGGRGNCSQGV